MQRKTKNDCTIWFIIYVVLLLLGGGAAPMNQQKISKARPFRPSKSTDTKTNYNKHKIFFMAHALRDIFLKIYIIDAHKHLFGFYYPAYSRRLRLPSLLLRRTDMTRKRKPWIKCTDTHTHTIAWLSHFIISVLFCFIFLCVCISRWLYIELLRMLRTLMDFKCKCN